MSEETILEVEGLKKSYGKLDVLKSINFELKRGEVVCVIGPSGSGKSTMLRCLNLLEMPDGGHITLHGNTVFDGSKPKDLDVLRREVGMVFQSFNLFPHMSAMENVSIAQKKVRGRKNDACRDRSLDLLNQVGLSDKAVSRSPVPWPWTRRSCSSTKSPAPSTRNWSRECSTCCAHWPTKA